MRQEREATPCWNLWERSMCLMAFKAIQWRLSYSIGSPFHFNLSNDRQWITGVITCRFFKGSLFIMLLAKIGKIVLFFYD